MTTKLDWAFRVEILQEYITRIAANVDLLQREMPT